MAKSILTVFIDCFKLLKKEPKLFIPKIIIAVFYTIAILLTAGVSTKLLSIISKGFIAGAELLEINALMLQTLSILLFLIALMCIDTIATAMYSFMAKDFFEGKKISLVKSLRLSLEKFLIFIPSALVSLIAASVIGVLFLVPAGLFLLQKSYLIALVLIVFFVLGMFLVQISFFSMFPVGAIERKNFIGTIFDSIFVAKKHFLNISKATIFSFVISLISIGLAFLSQSFFEVFAIFLLFRILIALIYTYIAVINPVFYLEFEKGAKI